MATDTKKKSDAEGDEATEEKGGIKKFLPAIVGVVIVAAAYFLFLAPKPAEDPEAMATEEVAEPAEGEIVPVGTQTINLKGDGTRYARIEYALVLAAETVAADVETRLPLMKDATLSEVAKWGPDDLRTPAGHQLLRDGLTSRAQDVWPGGEVLRVILTEFIVQ